MSLVFSASSSSSTMVCSSRIIHGVEAFLRLDMTTDNEFVLVDSSPHVCLARDYVRETMTEEPVVQDFYHKVDEGQRCQRTARRKGCTGTQTQAGSLFSNRRGSKHRTVQK